MKKVILNEKYELGAGLGCWAKSREYVTIQPGDVRFIGGMLMYAYSVKYCLITCEVNWTPIDHRQNFEDLRNWMNRIND
jgi:hypothetical protein